LLLFTARAKNINDAMTVNDLENFKAILEQYFGGGTATFDTNSGVTNNVVGALNHTDFVPFRSALAKK
jgi:hypothetical protein